MAPGDEQMVAWVRDFNAFDLYTKASQVYSHAALKEYYIGLAHKFCPAVLDW